MTPIGPIGRRTFLAIPAAVMATRAKPAKAQEGQKEAFPVLHILSGGEVYTQDNAASLLQGFLGIMGVVGKKDGRLTKPEIQQYHDYYKRLRVIEPRSLKQLVKHLEQNFDILAKRDGNAESISCNDLVTLRKD